MNTSPEAVAERRIKLSDRDQRLGLLYDEAVRLREPRGLAEAMTLGHMVREIVDGLIISDGRSLALGGALERSEEMEAGLERLRAMALEPTTEDPTEHLRTLAAELDRLLQGKAPRPRTLTDQLTELVSRLGLPPQAQAPLVASLGKEARNLANDAGHFGEQAADAQRLAQEALANLELFLDAVDPDFTPRFDRLQEFLQMAAASQPLTPAIATQLAAFIAEEDAYRHFFLTLEEPSWLSVLRVRGLLARRAPVEQTDSGQRVGLAWWPGEYLVRIAGQAPVDAVEAFLAEAPTSDIRQIASVGRRVAQRLGVEHYSRELHRRILLDLQILRSERSDWSSGAHEAIALVEHLNSSGLTAQAADIVQVLSAPELETDAPVLVWNVRRTRAGLSYWPLSNLAKNAVESMGNNRSLALFTVLCKTIQEHLEFTYPESAPHDYTYIGRKKWTDDDRGYEDSISILLRALYRECRRLQNSGVPLQTVVERLVAFKWSAMRRLAMRLIADKPDDGLDQGVRILLDREQFSDPTVRPEYAALATALAPLLRPDQVAAYCELVGREINPESVGETLKERSGDDDIALGKVERLVAAWRRDRLAPLQSVLRDPWKAAFDQAIAEHGQPLVHSDVEVGPGGIVPPTDLSRLTPGQILERIRATAERVADSSPTSDLFFGVSKAVQKRPEELATPEFAKGVPPSWIGVYLSGLHDAVRAGLAPATALACIVAIQQANDTLNEHAMRSLSWAIQEIVGRPATSSAEMKACIAILEHIATTAEDSPCRNIWDAADETLNRARTHALKVLIEIQLAARRDPPAHPEEARSAAGAMNRVVEAWPRDSTGLACVLGQHFNHLWWLDRDWAKAHRDQAFGAGSAQVRNTAWVSYITWTQPASEVAATLDDQYQSAIQTFTADRPDNPTRGGSLYVDGLARHLTALWYWGRGSAALRGTIQSAPSELAGHIVQEVSHVLAGSAPDEHREIVERIGTLLDAYAALVRAGRLVNTHGFSWLRIASQEGHFSAERRLRWMQVALEVEEGTHVDYEALAAVMRDARSSPDLGAEVLATAFDRAPFYVLREEAARLIDGLDWFCGHANAEAKKQLAVSCDRLVAKGHAQYRDIYHRLRGR